MTAIRKSVPTSGVSAWWDVGWMYVMPDFDNKDHSIIEWRSTSAPVEPNRVPVITNTEDAHGDDRRQQPA